MNIKELKKELIDDYYSLIGSSTFDRLSEKYYHERVRAKIKKEALYPRFYNIKTKAKNQWLFYFSKSHEINKFHCVDDSVYMQFCYYNSPIGIQVFMLDDKGGSYVYNAHLFQRYNERMNLEIPNSLDVIKHYLVSNVRLIVQLLLQEDGTCKFYGMVLDGFVLGNYYTEHYLFECKTFISHSTANKINSKFERDFLNKFKSHFRMIDPERDLKNYKELSLIIEDLKI